MANAISQFLATIVIDVHTREILGLRAYDGWGVDSYWTIRAFNSVARAIKRVPLKVVHDHGSTFLGQFVRQLSVLEIEEELTPAYTSDHFFANSFEV